jgi:hypothetical protein
MAGCHFNCQYRSSSLSPHRQPRQIARDQPGVGPTPPAARVQPKAGLIRPLLVKPVQSRCETFDGWGGAGSAYWVQNGSPNSQSRGLCDLGRQMDHPRMNTQSSAGLLSNRTSACPTLSCGTCSKSPWRSEVSKSGAGGPIDLPQPGWP